MFKAFLQWIYSGECDFPKDVFSLIALLNLTDEYLLNDLAQVCEEQILEAIDGISALEILTSNSVMLPPDSEAIVKDMCKSVLLHEYAKLQIRFPDIEERIASVKGLMSELFTHKR